MNYFLNLALIILYDENRRFLLQHRTEDAVRLPDYWGFFGGGIKPGESAEQAVFRETLEELNYYLKNPLLAFQQSFKLGDQPGFMNVFIELFKGNKSTIRLQEGQGMGWYSESESQQLKMVPHDHLVISTINQLLIEN